MSGYISAVSVVAALASTAMTVASSVEQSNTQREQADYQAGMAEYNAKVAENNARYAEDEGKQLKQQADEAATRKRQETALLIGQQRAKQGASGAVIDVGSNLDLSLDTAERGELDALQLEEQGYWQDYNKRLDAQNYRSQGAVANSQADMYSSKANQYSPMLQTGNTILTGANKVGKLVSDNNFLKFQ